MKFLLVAALLLAQFGLRAPLTPAETLLEPAMLKAMAEAPVEAQARGPELLAGTDNSAGEIVVVSPAGQSIAASMALNKLAALIDAKALPRPARSIRFLTSGQNAVDTATLTPPAGAKAAIMAVDSTLPTLQVIRGLWSTASIVDEVVERFVAQVSPVVDVRRYRRVGQPQWEAAGIPVTTILTGDRTDVFSHGATAIAASAYFLATLPNAGSEALLSHLTVGAHARLAEDGRNAVAQMGNQQRAGADVLIALGQAIEREQRRMRSFERFMPSPVDPMLHSRILDMEKGITGVWTSLGITSSPFVPAAERIRGRGGEDRRVPVRRRAGPLPEVELPTAWLKFENVEMVVYELGNFVDGKRSISDIRDAVSAEFAPIALPVVVDYFERLAKLGAIGLK